MRKRKAKFRSAESNPSPEPTQFEIESAAYRRAVADDSLRDLRRAIAACGPDADAYGCWTLRDKLGVAPDRVFYCCQRDGKGWQPPAPDDDTRVADDPIVTTDGRQFFKFRYSVYFQRFNEYHPQSAEQLATARVERERRKMENERRRLPLYAEQIK